jgi:DNA-binding response OmpR family regulator
VYMNFKVLLIDENTDSKKPIIDIIGEKYVDVEHYLLPEVGLQHLGGNNNYDLILLNIEKDGLNFFDDFLEFNIPIIVMAEKDNEDLALSMIRRGAHDYLVKNGVLNPRGVRRVIMHTVERSAFIKHNLEPISQCEIVKARNTLREYREQINVSIREIGAFNAAFSKYSVKGISD